MIISSNLKKLSEYGFLCCKTDPPVFFTSVKYDKELFCFDEMENVPISNDSNFIDCYKYDRNGEIFIFSVMEFHTKSCYINSEKLFNVKLNYNVLYFTFLHTVGSDDYDELYFVDGCGIRVMLK